MRIYSSTRWNAIDKVLARTKDIYLLYKMRESRSQRVRVSWYDGVRLPFMFLYPFIIEEWISEVFVCYILFTLRTKSTPENR